MGITSKANFDYSKRDYCIDLLKVVCLFAVLALHTQRNTTTGELYNWVLYYGCRFAMPVFFMVNGYLILSKQSFPKEYCRCKIINIIRVLFTWGGVEAFVSLLLSHDFYFSIKVFFVAVLVGNTVPIWFLHSFILIYVILMYKFDFIKRNIKSLMICLFVVCLVIDILSIRNIFANNGYFIQSVIPQQYRIWTWLFYFILGYYLKILAVPIVSSSKVKMIICCLLCMLFTAVSVAMQYILCAKILGKINSEYLYDNIIVIFWSVLIFVIFNCLKIEEVKIVNCISWLSNYSFGVFLIHSLLLKYCPLFYYVSGNLGALLRYFMLCISSYIFVYGLMKIPILKKALKY